MCVEMSDALPQSFPPGLSQIPQPYPNHPSVQSNEQTLISFD